MSDRQAKKDQEHLRDDRGFTLVELLIVIVILGILATVTVFAVGGITSTAEENACGVERRTLVTAASGYMASQSVDAIPGGDSEARNQTLVTASFIRESGADKFDLAADGTVTIRTGGPCDLT